MAQSKAFADASRALNDLSHALALLEAENAKLRELAYILVYCLQDKDCDGCRLNGERGEIIADPLVACVGLRGLLREAGIEVPE